MMAQGNGLGSTVDLSNPIALASVQSGGDPRTFLAILASWAVQNIGRMAAAGGSAKPLIRDPEEMQRAFSWARQVAERRQIFPDTANLARQMFQLRPLMDEVGGSAATPLRTEEAILENMAQGPSWQNNLRSLLESLGKFYGR